MAEIPENKESTKQENKCDSCLQSIADLAKVCHHCGQPQKWWRKLLRGSPIVVSIAMMVIAAVQLTLAFSERIDASNALKKAEHALAQVLSDANEINKLKYVIENQGAQVEVVSKMAFKAENLLSEIAELQKKSGLINEFMMIAIAAQNDDREAFDKLGIWAVDPCFPFFELAKLAYIRIRLSYNEFTAREYLEFPWKEVWKEVNEPNKIPFSNLCEVYHASSPNFHTSLLKIIWERKDMPRKKRMQFLVDILTKDESLAATYWAGE